MTLQAQDVLSEALALPLEERADAAAELLTSLDEVASERPADVEAAGPPKSNVGPAGLSQTGPVEWRGTTSVAALKPNVTSGESSRSR